MTNTAGAWPALGRGYREHPGAGGEVTSPARTSAALYLRVSKDNGSQTVENQRPDLERLAQARGFTVVNVYEEQASAAKHRPAFEALMADARRGSFKVVLVWALDRLHRSMVGSITTLLELDRIGVQVVSTREPWLDTSGPVRSLLVAIFGWVAEQERARLIDRTKAGLERARREGKRLGRPPASPVLLSAAADLVASGISVAEAARAKGVKRTTLRRFLAR
jgi:putative DNA-invertase from lambdoid prophage Rac